MTSLADKLPNAPYGIAAKFDGNVTAPDQDGQSWHVLVGDGSSPSVQIKVSLSGTEMDPTSFDSTPNF